eukprot:TRINITY_DN275_c0_g1_i1.p1 TRINITY_DN275_c0_g1~~TRINITY_DN275_c0_g1_i1.p1  ORF type:complete len:474 (-),score=86.90 TRINITY_DN275_c0_g1_i1:57-1478(-)
MFSIGVGPSSSHTVGPMRAANAFTQRLTEKNLFEKTARVKTELFGSLALTGEGHGTPKAILMGLEGNLPDTIDPSIINHRVIDIRTKNLLKLGGNRDIEFNNSDLLLCKTEFLPFHSNGMRFTAYDKDNSVLDRHQFYSIGGGFILCDDQVTGHKEPIEEERTPKYEYHTAKELIAICDENNMSIAQVQMANEIAYGRTEQEVIDGLDKIWATMNGTIERGMRSEEAILPGGLGVRRRAPAIFKMLDSPGKVVHEKLRAKLQTMNRVEPAGQVMDWITLYAMAVNEENAAGGKVVTAPTNGAAGVIPAVLRYFLKWSNPESDKSQVITEYLLTAGAIGMLFKKGASISAAEVGCQGEIGVACSMAAAGLCGLYGGSPIQCSVAAEIGMEHHLGMTCDPIGGLVQVPCIERNAMGSIKAVNAARLAIHDDGSMVVSLDDVIETMLRTGREMSTSYKETSQAGLALRVPQALVSC